MLVIARYIVRAFVLLLPFLLKDPAILLIGVHALSVVFSTLLRPAKSDAPTRILNKPQHMSSVVLRSILLISGMAMILFSIYVPNSLLLSAPGALLYWAANADSISSEVLLFSLIRDKDIVNVDDQSPSS
jgi:hypothetical protein